MKKFTKISATEINENFIELIGKKWMLITANKGDDVNTMTASWDGVGELWNKNVTFTFIRPTRYTYEFVENNDLFTLSFFDEEYREKLAYLGKVSGRDEDKIGKMGLTVVKDGDVSSLDKQENADILKAVFQQVSLCCRNFVHAVLLTPNKCYSNQLSLS